MKHLENFFEEDILEFEWFSDEIEALDEDAVYSEIMDLKLEVEKGMEREEEIWKPEKCFYGDLNGMMKTVFSDVQENLCGRKAEICSSILAAHIKELSQYCEVLSSDLYDCLESEVCARIEKCIDEKGCVIAVVDNGQWENDGKQEMIFLDDGMRVLEVIGIDDKNLIINDYGRPDGENIQVQVTEFVKMNGVLLEVLK